MKLYKNIYCAVVILLVCSLISCEDFVDIETPNHKMVSEVVFNSDEAAMSAMTGIYNQLFTAFFSSGGSDSVTVLAGLSGDIITTIRSTNLPYLEFEQHEILPNNFRNLNLWSGAYNIIYMTNSLLEGLTNSENISGEVKNHLEGEARFIRAFTYFYLVNLYGEVPLILTTDYRDNSLAAREKEDEIYLQILEDLEMAIGLMNDNYLQDERTRINRNVGVALMARVQLYLQNWEEAEKWSSEVLENTDRYEILEDLNQVFLANSKEAIWQLSPTGRGSILTHTNEGAEFIIHPFLTFLSHLRLNDNFVTSFDEVDQRLLQWTGYHVGTSSYYPYKYKIDNSTDEPTEYSMVLRFAEQYLIRAEARTMQNNYPGAIADLDRIRSRAGLERIAENNPAISKEALLDLIMEERKKELFAEWGHRWLDLKRTGRADDIFDADNPQWQDTDEFYPIPEEELMKNINLTQNNGY